MAFAPKSKVAGGFSLIEVLIAVVILSVGLLALASLQISMVRASAATKAQSIAANLGKEKLEQMRSFRTLAGYVALTTATPALENLPDSGGNQGGIDFTRTTVVTRYVYNQLPLATPTGFVSVGNTTSDAALTAAKTSTVDYALGKDFKLVKVTVGWTDATGTPATVALEDIIDGLDPTESASIVKSGTNISGPRTLEAKITDPALDNMVIPIALGGGVDSAATNPKPTVVVGGNTVETRFDVLTYAGVNGGTATAQQKVETVMVGCTCTLSSPPATTVRGERPSYWNGSRYTPPLDVATSGSESYSPPGKADPASSASQSTHCDICCRDHVDPIGVKGATFSPRLVSRNSSDVVTVAHDHFFDKTSTIPAASGTYKEACRIIRVDGIWSVAADLAVDHFGLLATGDGTTAPSYAPDSTSVDGTPSTVGALARYQNFVLGYMGSRFVSPTPTTGTEQSTYNTVGTPFALAVSAPYVLDHPTSVTIDPTFTGTPVCSVITGISKTNPAVVTHSSSYTNCSGATIAGPAYVNGDSVYLTNVAGMTQINNPGGRYIVANATATTFQLSGVDTSVAAYSAYTSGGIAEVSHGKWLHSRGLYVDYLEKEATDAITLVKGDSACNASSSALALCVLRLLPFTSINLTEIADWDSADSGKAIVDNNNYSQTLTQTEPVRGKTSFAPGAADGTRVAVTSRSRKRNSSLLDLSFDSISPADIFTWDSPQSFLINNPVPAPKPGNGTFYTALSLAAKTGQGVNYLTGTQASKPCSNYSAAALSYPCPVNNAESTTIAPVDSEDAGLGIAGTMGIEVVGYNSTGTVTSTSTLRNMCTGAFGLKDYVSVTSGPAGNRSDPANYTLNTCTTYDVSSAQNLTTTAPASGSAPYSVTGNSTLAEKTRIYFPLISKDPNTADAVYVDKISVSFGPPTTTTLTVASCSYVCTSVTAGNCTSVATTRFTITSNTCP